MSSERSRVTLRQFRTLFHSGTGTGLTDGQLLERFGAGNADSAEAAFSALVERHGPMVLRTCRGIVRDEHHAEDAFQATFLILARKGRSLWVRDSIGPWLHRVARRAALRARGRARQSRDVERRGAKPEVPPRDRSSAEEWIPIVHEEIDRLPERYRVPVVLCDLEGRSYEEAARHMNCPLGTIMSRLARGRLRLQGSLARRGLAPAIAATALASDAEASALPAGLAAETARRSASLAAGTVSESVKTLMAEVSRMMLLTKLKTVAGACLATLLVGGGSLLAWQTGQVPAVDRRPIAPAPRLLAQGEKPRPKPEAAKTKTSGRYRFEGSVKVEGTGEPVKGAMFDLMLGDSGTGLIRPIKSGGDGTFAVDIPAGQARAWTFFPPPGYWMPDNGKSQETFVVSPSRPVHRKDYVVRRGRVWHFLLERGKDHKPASGWTLFAQGDKILTRTYADDRGIVELTLPAEGGKFGLVAFLKSEAGVSRELTVEAGAGDDLIVLQEDRRVEATRFEDKLVYRIVLPEAAPSAGNLAGRVVDNADRPIEGARVQVGVGETQSSGLPGIETTTDDRGRFQVSIPPLPINRPGGEEPKIFAVVTKEGYAGVDTPRKLFRPVGDGPRHDLGTITLQPGQSIRGKVIGPDGKPLEGAWVEPGGSYAARSCFARTDEDGRFTVKDLPKGMVRLNINYDNLAAERLKFLAGLGDVEEEIRLRAIDDILAEAKSRNAVPAKPLGLGQLAPEWDVRDWTDGKPRKLADLRGKIVFLDFWGMWCGPCVGQLPVLEKLRKKYEPGGVVFVSIHTAGENVDRVRRFLEFSKSTLISAIDVGDGRDVNGTTADRYGVHAYPTLVLIDRTGKIAFRSDDQSQFPKVEAIMKELGIDPKTGTEAQNHRLIETIFSREIDTLLKRP